MCVFAAGLRLFMMSTIQKPEVLFILGGPGAGKGTLCSNITDKYGYVHLSAGDLLREERAKPGSQYGELIENHIKNGTIVPVAITCNLLDRAIQSSQNPHKKFLIDGFPRNQDNIDGWNKVMSDKCTVKGVLFCECSREICTQRCLKRGAEGSGRCDDNLNVLAKRHETYIINTLPIIEHFEKQGLVYKLNSTQSPKNVFEDAVKILTEIGW
ncbi:cytidine/uridine monophosphate kinase Dak1 isoform X2 [Ptiloglossa arizonensis]|uniref:cytidine/uridine monophosphate kinase Dak1 isoform X2 n=1 Tax=Ptiloglossa arizonensis TaxID=3350558 RepID=UPI003FA18CBC